MYYICVYLCAYFAALSTSLWISVFNLLNTNTHFRQKILLIIVHTFVYAALQAVDTSD
jgi:hypothetical protein